MAKKVKNTEASLEVKETVVETPVEGLTTQDPFKTISDSFYQALDELRLENETKLESKVLIANAGAYMKKALNMVDIVRELP